MQNNIISRSMGFKEWAMLIVLSILWGGSFFFVGVAVKELTPFVIVFFRVGLAAVVLLGVVYLSGQRMPSSPKIWLSFLVMGILNNLIPFSLIVWGQTHIESGLASILNATTPIFSVVLAHLLTKEEKLTTLKLIGVLIGWMGVIVLIGFESLKGLGVNVLAQIAILGAATSYAFAAIYGRRFAGLSPLVVSAGMLTCSTIMVLPLALVESPVLHTLSLSTIAALAGLAVFSTSLAYLIYFKVLASAGATNILLVTFLIPLSAIMLGFLFLDERLSMSIFWGMGLIFLGLIAIDGRVLKKLSIKKLPANQIKNDSVRYQEN